MPKMTDSDLKAILGAEKTSALAGMMSSKLSSERANAMAYYLGDMTKDLPSAAGRSSAVSTDVADTVEGLMPALMEIFCGSDEVVKFNAVGPEDVEAAQQETDYVNHVFLQQNPGFLILYSFIKDALLQKNGFAKAWWETKTEEERETYYDLDDDQFAMLLADEDVEIIEHTVKDAGAEPEPPVQLAPARTHDVTVVRSKKYAQARVVGIPPEEFGIARNARTLKDADYAFHRVITTHGKLVAEGYDEKVIKTIPSYLGFTNVEELERNTVDEYQQGQAQELNEPTRQIEITEHYVRMDYEGNGKPCLYKVTTGGTGGNETLLTKEGKTDIEPFDQIPIVSMTPIIQTHRFFGRSVADIVMDIQRIKTALLRGVLDNTYMVNRPRMEVAESHAGDNTLDDLLVSRENGIVRTKQPGGLNALNITPIADKIFPVIGYMDETREWRTGVTRQGQGIDANALQNQSATAVNQAFTAAQARMKLIARIFAETGIRDLFELLHAVIRKHGQEKQTVQLRNKWVEVNPREWRTRKDMTVSVGLGNGGKAEQAAHMTMLMGVQKEMVMGGMTNVVQPKHIYHAAAKLTELTGNKDVENYFADPEAKDPNGQLVNPPPAPKPDPEMAKLQAEAQMRSQEMQGKAQLDQQSMQQKAQIETVQAQADIATQNKKTEAEMALAQQKFQFERELMLMEFQAKAADRAAEMEMKRELHQHTIAKSQFTLAAGAQSHAQKMEQTSAAGAE